MQLLENRYEKALLLQLPPKARDIAENWLAQKPLNELLELSQKNKPNTELLEAYDVPDEYWQPIINATVLAKTTYFLANSNFSQEEILYLIKSATASAGMPLGEYTLGEVIKLSKADLPILNLWLMEFAQLLKAVRQSSVQEH